MDDFRRVFGHWNPYRLCSSGYFNPTVIKSVSPSSRFGQDATGPVTAYAGNLGNSSFRALARAVAAFPICDDACGPVSIITPVTPASSTTRGAKEALKGLPKGSRQSESSKISLSPLAKNDGSVVSPWTLITRSTFWPANGLSAATNFWFTSGVSDHDRGDSAIIRFRAAIKSWVCCALIADWKCQSPTKERTNIKNPTFSRTGHLLWTDGTYSVPSKITPRTTPASAIDISEFSSISQKSSEESARSRRFRLAGIFRRCSGPSILLSPVPNISASLRWLYRNWNSAR